MEFRITGSQFLIGRYSSCFFFKKKQLLMVDDYFFNQVNYLLRAANQKNHK